MTPSPKPSRAFEPYIPPNEEAGPLTVDKDLCWRLNSKGLVTPAVIGALCSVRNHFRMSALDHRAPAWAASSYAPKKPGASHPNPASSI